MSACNYCTFQRFKEQAQAEGKTVTIRPHPIAGFDEGVTVYIHPAGDDPENHWRAWLAKLPEECHCDDD